MDYHLIDKFSPTQLGAIAACSAVASYALFRTVKNSKPYAPGPPRAPIAGNLLNFPLTGWYDKFCQWQRLYGDLVYIQLPGTTILIVNNFDKAQELLNKNPDLSSGRTIGYMMNELMDYKWHLGLRPADEAHAEIRKMLRRGIGPQKIVDHDNVMQSCTEEFMISLEGLRGDPTPLVVRTLSRSVIEIAYGEKIWKDLGKELMELNKQSFGLFSQCINTVWFVNVFEFLRFVPRWVPGARFQRLAKSSRGYSQQVKTLGWQRLVELHSLGVAGPSWGASLLDEYGPSDNVRDALGLLYFNGSNNTSSIICHFLHAMFMFPDIAEKVHEEIVKVIGEDRLPTIADRSSLPYTEAVWKESLRWRPGVPLAFPHTTSEDQMYHGYFVPKGTLIEPNYGCILNDPSKWAAPEVFRPERFLPEHNPHAKELPDPTQVIFGFGTRVCPGKHFSERIGFHVAATTMALYKIAPLEGQPIPNPAEVRYNGNLVRYPADFNCRFIPWGPKSASLLSSLSQHA